MTASAEKIRSKNDLDMFEALLQHRDVERTNERLARIEESTPTSVRRRLLATSVRLTERMAPAIHEMADECASKLEIGIPHELYVYSGPQFNAACFKPEDERLCVMFSSGLLEAFEGNELKFVVGHELGHHVYRHHDIPIGFLLRGETRPDPRLALQLFSWSRYAEISADRAGAHCAADIVSVSRALFKLASGLTGRMIEFNLDDFLSQVDAMQVEDAEPGQGAPTEDWFSTHPFSPLRVKALQLFNRSALAQPDGFDAQELETRVQSLMSLMEPGYLEGKTKAAESMRRLLFAGGLLVANTDGGISEEEHEAFEKFFGRGSISDNLNFEALEQELDDRVRQVKSVATTLQAMQVLHDICLIAKAEGHTTEAELAILERIADGLGIGRSMICQTMEGDCELD
ncbi:MAG: M48 family metallopeptidase [Gammaproteobacteria bacterium]